MYFVFYSEASYKADFISAFRFPRLHCASPSHGAPCPISSCVDRMLCKPQALSETMHLDHEQDVVTFGSTHWPRYLRLLEFGMTASTPTFGAVCSLEWTPIRRTAQPMLRFRRAGRVGVRRPAPRAATTHKQNMPHTTCTCTCTCSTTTAACV